MTANDTQVLRPSFELARVLKGLRTSMMWTQDDLAAKTGLTRSYISRVENAETDPRVEEVTAWARACGKQIGDLFPCTDWRTVVVRRIADALKYEGDLLSDPTPEHIICLVGDADNARRAILDAIKAQSRAPAAGGTWADELERLRAHWLTTVAPAPVVPQVNAWREVLVEGLVELGVPRTTAETMRPGHALQELASRHRANVMEAQFVRVGEQRAVVWGGAPAAPASPEVERTHAVVMRCCDALSQSLQAEEDGALLALVDIIRMALQAGKGVGRG